MTEVKIPDLGGATMTVADVGGYIQPIFWKSATEVKDIFDKVPDFKFRDDDVMLLNFPKTGTNWLYEILTMVLNKSSESVKTSKIQTMIEANAAELFEQVPSPRVMNSHYPPRYLPIKGLREKKIKTILCLRNPKDVAVSFYNHTKGMKVYDYDGKFEDWLPVFMQGKRAVGNWKSWFTVAQNEEFDKIWGSEMKGHDMFKFKYTMSSLP